MKKLIFGLIFVISLMMVVTLPAGVSAQSASSSSAMTSNHLLDMLTTVGESGGYNTDSSVSTPVIIGTVVRLFLNFLGIIFIILMILAGYSWMTAGGNEEKVKKAVNTIKQALIGLIVAISAWTLWNFVLEKLILMK